MSCKQLLLHALACHGEERLRLLIFAWRIKPAAELGELILALAADLDRKRATIAGKTVEARLATWLKLEQQRDEALTGWLLVSPPLQDTLAQHYEPRIARVAKWAPDPRIAPAMLAIIADRTFAAIAKLWDPVFAQLAKCGDASCVPALRAEREAEADKFFATRLDKVIATLAKKKPPKLAPGEKQVFAQMAKPVAPTESALLAAVWAAPADDGPRLIYADYLQERGDPRGEFIALQCAKQLEVEGRKRMRALYAKYKLKWFGPIEPAILEQKSFVYERGFLASCWICTMWGSNPDDLSDPRERAIRALQDHPAWATLREVKMTPLGKRTRAPLIAHAGRLGVKVTFGK